MNHQSLPPHGTDWAALGLLGLLWAALELLRLLWAALGLLGLRPDAQKL